MGGVVAGWFLWWFWWGWWIQHVKTVLHCAFCWWYLHSDSLNNFCMVKNYNWIGRLAIGTLLRNLGRRNEEEHNKAIKT